MNEKEKIEKIEKIKELVKENPDTKITTSGLRVNFGEFKHEDEVRELVEESEDLFNDEDVIKLNSN